MPLGEGHLCAAVRAFVHHHHKERPHQGVGNELIAPKITSIGTGPVTCRERLGGALRFYYPRGRVTSSAEFSHTAGAPSAPRVSAIRILLAGIGQNCAPHTRFVEH